MVSLETECGATVDIGLKLANCTASWPDGLASFLELFPCPALIFSLDGELSGLNSKARAYYKSCSGDVSTLTFQKLAQCHAQKESKVVDIRQLFGSNAKCRFQVELNSDRTSKWLLTEASMTKHPLLGEDCILVLQVDVTEAQHQEQIVRVAEDRLRQQMQALQRKLIRMVTENEALHQVIDKLQGNILGLRRQLLENNQIPDSELEEYLLKPQPHSEVLKELLKGIGKCPVQESDADSALGKKEYEPISGKGANPVGAGQSPHAVHLLQDVYELQRLNSKLQLEREQSQWDAAVYRARVSKVNLDQAELKANYDALEHEWQLDRATAQDLRKQNQVLYESAQAQKMEYDTLYLTATELKNGYDKLALDASEQKTQLDSVLLDTAAQKLAYDKIVYDAAEQQLQLSTEKEERAKAVATATELKQAYDSLAAETEAKETQYYKLMADAEELKHLYDQLEDDAVKQKEESAGLLQESAIHKLEYDKRVMAAFYQEGGSTEVLVGDRGYDHDQLVAVQAEQQVGYKKLLADSTMQKQQYNMLVDKSAEQRGQLAAVLSESRALKAEYEELLLGSPQACAAADGPCGSGESLRSNELLQMVADLFGKNSQQAAGLALRKVLKAYPGLQVQLECPHQDSAKEKGAGNATYQALLRAYHEQSAAHDKLLVDSSEQKATLDKLTSDAAEYKAGYDKLMVDSAEQKAEYDKLLVDSTEYKAGYDKLLVDSAEQKAQYDKLIVDSAEQKAEYDKLLVDSTEYKAGYDKLMVDSAEQKAQYDKLIVDSAEQKAGYDKLMVDSAEQKAQYDKLLVDSAEEKAGYDKLMVDSAEQKAQYDKLIVDSAEQKAGYDKLMVDSAEQKAQYDKLLVDSAEQKAGYDKLMVDSAEQKAQYDKLIVDSAEEKAGYDKLMVDSAEYKAGYDKLLVDSSVLKSQYDKVTADYVEQDAFMNKLMADSAEQKAEYDKLMVDSAEQKAGYDKLLADSAEQKAEFDKLLVDSSEQKAQYDKLIVDSAETKAGYDKLAVDSAEQKAEFDKLLIDSSEQKAMLDKITVDTAELKAEYDKLQTDAVEAQVAYQELEENHRQVMSEAMEYKAGYDKLLVDTAEQKAGYDKLVVDAAELKAGYDKLVVDASDQKSQFDKLVVDSAEQQMEFDKVVHDSQLLKHRYDKLEVDAAEQKAVFDQQKSEYDKLLVDATSLKAQYDKLSVDATEQKEAYDEQKAAFDKLIEETATQRAEFEATKQQYEAVLVQAMEQKKEYDKLMNHADELKSSYETLMADAEALRTDYESKVAEYDKLQVDSSDQKTELMEELQKQKLALNAMHINAAAQKEAYNKVLSDSIKQRNQLTAIEKEKLKLKQDFERLTDAQKEQKALIDKLRLENSTAEAAKRDLEQVVGTLNDDVSRMMSERDRLLQQQEVLKAELQIVLGNYKPRAKIDAGTPADKILAMMTDLLEGAVPNIEDILLVQSTILESHDIYRPFRLTQQIMDASNLEEDAGLCLVQLLADKEEEQHQDAESVLSLEEFCRDRRSKRGSTRASSSVMTGDLYDDSQYTTLQGSLMQIMHSNVYTSEEDLDLIDQGSPPSSSTHFSRALHRAALTNRSGRPKRLSRMSLSSGPDLSEAPWGSEVDAGDIPDLEESVPPTPLAPVVYEEVEKVLRAVHDWQFDAFKLAEVTQNHPLSTLGFYLFHEFGLISRFNIRPVMLARFLRQIEEGYRNNPYHNRTHAADVLQTMNVIIHRGGLMPGYVDPLTLMGAYVAAIIHDFEHGGLTNDYLINTMDMLAIRYNDKAPLENHHLASSFGILRMAEFNFLFNLTKAEMDRFRKIVIEMVLATDMKQHFSIISHFTTIHRLSIPGSSTCAPSDVCRKSDFDSVGSLNSGTHSVHDDHILVPIDENERILALQMALKLSDVGHVTAALPVHLRWVSQLEEEFFRQGDQEAMNKMQVSSLFDRSKQGVSKSQVGFFDIVVIPMFHTYCKVFTATQPLLTYVMRNYRHWVNVEKAAGKEAES